VQAYRLFYFDEADHIRKAVVLECDSDDEAVALALQRSDGRAMELWLQTRLVRPFPLEGDPDWPVKPQS
jgi:hypothetical protein